MFSCWWKIFTFFTLGVFYYTICIFRFRHPSAIFFGWIVKNYSIFYNGRPLIRKFDDYPLSVVIRVQIFISTTILLSFVFGFTCILLTQVLSNVEVNSLQHFRFSLVPFGSDFCNQPIELFFLTLHESLRVSSTRTLKSKTQQY